LIGLLLAAAVASAPCPAGLVLEGDPEAVANVRAELGRRPEGPGAGCRTLRARIDAADDGWIVSAGGSSLLVHSARTAAAWLESRLRPDLSAPLIDLALLDDVPAPADAPPTIAATTARSPVPLEVGLRAEVAWTTEGTESGAAATFSLGGWALEPVAILRGAASGRLEPDGLPPVKRWEAEALVGARLPWRRGPLALLPGIGLGLGIDGTSRDACEGCLPVVEDDASSIAASMRTEGFVDATLRLASGLALALSLSASASPFAKSAPTLPAWLPPDRDGAAHLALPAPPVYRLRAGAGLVWSLR